MKDFRLTARQSVLIFVVSIGALALLRWLVVPMLGLRSTQRAEPLSVESLSMKSILGIGLSLLAFLMMAAAAGSVCAFIAALLPERPK